MSCFVERMYSGWVQPQKTFVELYELFVVLWRVQWVWPVIVHMLDWGIFCSCSYLCRHFQHFAEHGSYPILLCLSSLCTGSFSRYLRWHKRAKARRSTKQHRTSLKITSTFCGPCRGFVSYCNLQPNTRGTTLLFP